MAGRHPISVFHSGWGERKYNLCPGIKDFAWPVVTAGLGDVPCMLWEGR